MASLIGIIDKMIFQNTIVFFYVSKKKCQFYKLCKFPFPLFLGLFLWINFFIFHAFTIKMIPFSNSYTENILYILKIALYSLFFTSQIMYYGIFNTLVQVNNILMINGRYIKSFMCVQVCVCVIYQNGLQVVVQ